MNSAHDLSGRSAAAEPLCQLFFAACCGKTDAYAFALDTVRTGSGGEQPVFPVDPAAALAGMVSAGV